MEWAYGIDDFYSKLSGLRDGGLAGAEAKNGIRLNWGLEFHSRAIVGSAKVGLVVDLDRRIYFTPVHCQFLDSEIRRVNAIQASLNDWWEGGPRRLVYSMWTSCMYGRWADPFEESSEASIPPYDVVVSAVVLLSLVYQYLTGNVDTGSSKAYSRSSLDFRDIYVAVVLFLGAYVWIKFREVAPLRGVHKKTRVDKHGRITKVVYEPRFKPPRENGTVFQWIYLGRFATPEEASLLYQIAAFYYNKGQGGSLGLEDGRWFSIPPMSEAERSLTGADKRAWVQVQAKKVYKDIRKEKASAALLQELLEACEDQATPRQGADPSEASLLNSVEHQLPLLVSPAEKAGMPMAMVDDQGLGCASQSFGGMHEGFVTSPGHSLGFEEESAIAVSQLPSGTQSGMGMNNSNQLNSLQIVHNQQELITYQQQGVDPSEASLLNSAEHQVSLLVSPAEKAGMPLAMLDGQGLGCASQSFGGMHEGFVTSPVHSLGFEEESAIAVSQLPSGTQSGMGMNNSKQLNLLQIVHNLQELITYLQQQLHESGAQNSVLQNQQLFLQQQLEESRIRIAQLESQHFVQQQLQVINQGVPSSEVEMEE